MRSRQKEGWIYLGLVIATLLVYLPLFGFPFINYDDPEYVTTNSHVITGVTLANVVWAFTSFHSGNWHPITWISHMMDCEFFGLRAGYHHGVNVILHVTNTLLLFGLLTRITKATWRSAFVAMIFGIHPLHVESVAWVSERKDVLSTFFMLLAIYAYAAYVSTATMNNQLHRNESISAKRGPLGALRKSSLFFYSLCLLLFALGLMSKAMVVTLPCLLLLLDYWPFRRFEAATGSLKAALIAPFVFEKIPFFALSFLSGLITYFGQKKWGSMSGMQDLSLGEKLVNGANAYLAYITKTVWPSKMAVFYPHASLQHAAATKAAGVVAAILLIAITAFALFQIKKRPSWFVGWFWFLGTLIPVIGVVQVGLQGMADRYTYVPMIGLLVCAAWYYQPSSRTVDHLIAAALSTAAVLVCLWKASGQVQYWHDDIALFSHSIEVTGFNPVAHFSLGLAFAENGDHARAESEFRAAVNEDPLYATAHYSLGVCLAVQQKSEQAAEEFRATLRLNPGHVLAHNGLGHVLLALQKAPDAEAEFKLAVTLDPGFWQGHHSLGTLFLEQRRFAEAAKQFDDVLRKKPRDAETLANLARACLGEGHLDQAEDRAGEAVALCPTNAELELLLGKILMVNGKTNEAEVRFSSADRFDPALADKQLEIGRSQAAKGNLDPAIANLKTAAWLRPQDAVIHQATGLALAQQGNLSAAIAEFQAANELKPEADTFHYLAMAYVAQSSLRAAVNSYEEALKLRPDWPVAMNDLAWILATSGDPALRDGARAVRLAEKACAVSGVLEARYWGTLDAAYAEAGRFSDAIRTAEKTRELAAKAGDASLSGAAETRLAGYRKNLPFRQ
ncbi:MAG TPA: tetratricopeptide repeat protein [Candidatus Dormibacteraeota bacterium]|nr:tetratricopeptide repeat protein [Candidatus Dormibacteraeota bacterium]